MKIVSATQMALLEKEAIEQNECTADELMNTAAEKIALVLLDYCTAKHIIKKVTLFTGKGNNGGDGYCTALRLLKMGFQLTVYSTASMQEKNPLCQKHAKAFEHAGGTIHHIHQVEQIHLPREGIVLDAIFGIGFKGALTEFLIQVIEKINQIKLPIFSIDIPSGLDGDSGNIDTTAVMATYTLFLGYPKLGFFINEGWNYVGELICIHLGLDPKWIKNVDAPCEMITKVMAAHLLPAIVRTRHKYQAGYVAGFCGSKGMMGSSILSGMGALKAGAGIVKMVHFDDLIIEGSHYPELIHTSFKISDMDSVVEYCQKASALLIGPGFGTDVKKQKFLAGFYKNVHKRIVIDADAINIMAITKIAPPTHSVLTPHRQEAARLLGIHPTETFEMHQACQQYVDKHQVVIVLKGAPYVHF